MLSRRLSVKGLVQYIEVKAIGFIFASAHPGHACLQSLNGLYVTKLACSLWKPYSGCMGNGTLCYHIATATGWFTYKVYFVLLLNQLFYTWLLLIYTLASSFQSVVCIYALTSHKCIIYDGCGGSLDAWKYFLSLSAVNPNQCQRQATIQLSHNILHTNMFSYISWWH